MTHPTDDRKRALDEQYFIMKRGYYYRPESCGYTSNPREAGLFSKEYAERHCKLTDELSMVPASQHFPSGKPLSYDELESKIEALTTQQAAVNVPREVVEALKTISIRGKGNGIGGAVVFNLGTAVQIADQALALLEKHMEKK